MKFLFCSDSFKGSMSSQEVNNRLEAAARKVFPNVETAKLPMADGGEGTAEALVSALNGRFIDLDVTGPEGSPVPARFALLGEDTAIVEMAAASGLTLLAKPKNLPLATSFGTGELIRAAVKRGCRRLLIAIGGSATNDGGTGALMALSARFYDEKNREIPVGNGEALANISGIDLAGLLPTLKECEIQVICDVTNPLAGPDGASFVYGPQKGGTPEQLDALELGMVHFADVAERALGKRFDHIPGAGAAGGMGFALTAFLGASLVRGVDAVLDLAGFDALARSADLIVTGEGSFDRQSLFGKVPVGVARRAAALGIPVAVLAGGLGEGAEEAYGHGISGLASSVCRVMPLEEALIQSGELFDQAAERMFRLIKLGMEIKCQ